MVNECQLQGGKGVLEKVKLRHYAAELVKPSEFRLGARIAEKFDGITVKEAKTESFVVKSYRNKYSQKIVIPCLEDNIWVLKNIQRRGNIDKRLQAKGIDTVEKFLIQLLINPKELRNIVGLGGEKWKAIVNHARKCQSNRMYCYTNSQETLSVVFNVFGRLQGLHSEGYYMATNMLSKNKKA
ncbi:calmodulin-binding protein 60 D-like [Henckelia pumila]|uniref:calmodulin-binding protein 60 D-like n=1 Tax=Henckelia pumila TaxID=405737 RepID=UPI003C6DD090